MQPLKAHVTDDALDDDAQAALLTALDDGIAAARRGEYNDADDFISELLADA